MTPAVIAYIIQAVNLLEQLVSAGINVSADLAALKAKLVQFQAERRDPNADEWAAQDAEIKGKLAALNS